MNALRLTLIAMLILTSPGHAAEVPGVTDKEILIELTGSLSGQFADGGRAVRSGVEAAIARANREGGIHGRTIKLYAMDDAYEPKRSRDNAEELILKKKVFALVGGNGGAGVSAMMPILDQTKTPMPFPYAANPELWDGKHRAVFALQAPAESLSDCIVDFLATEVKAKKIGIFILDDKNGASHIAPIAKALRRHEMAPAASCTAISREGFSPKP